MCIFSYPPVISYKNNVVITMLILFGSSTSYPDHNADSDDKMDMDEEVEGPSALQGDDFQLVLPSGITVGHRSLMR